MTLAEQLDGLPLFAFWRPAPVQFCAYCQTRPVVRSRVNLVHKKFCSLTCQHRARNLRRRAKAKVPAALKQSPLPTACQCGAALIRVESDWMTGMTMEVCARGHRTNPVLRRRLAA